MLDNALSSLASATQKTPKTNASCPETKRIMKLLSVQEISDEKHVQNMWHVPFNRPQETE